MVAAAVLPRVAEAAAMAAALLPPVAATSAANEAAEAVQVMMIAARLHVAHEAGTLDSISHRSTDSAFVFVASHVVALYV